MSPYDSFDDFRLYKFCGAQVGAAMADSICRLDLELLELLELLEDRFDRDPSIIDQCSPSHPFPRFDIFHMSHYVSLCIINFHIFHSFP